MGIRGVEGEVIADNGIILDLLSLFEGDRFHVRWVYDGFLSEYSGDELLSFFEVSALLREGRITALDIQIYPPEVREPQPIEHYEEFPDSPCKCVFLPFDSAYFEIYVKDGALLQKLYDRLAALGAENLIFKTDENDGRTRLSVY